MSTTAIPTAEQRGEAVPLGTPVIAAAAGPNLEAIRDSETGILGPPDQPSKFSRRAQTEARAECGIDRNVRAIAAICGESRA